MSMIQYTSSVSADYLRRKMKFYHITDEYITYLRKYDTKVAKNKQESRLYVGIVVQIE